MCVAAIIRLRCEDLKQMLGTVSAAGERGATGAANTRVAEQCAAVIGPEAVSKTQTCNRKIEAQGHSGVQTACLPVFFLLAASAQTYFT